MRLKRLLTIYLCFLLALILMIMPLPAVLQSLWPSWPILVIIYWVSVWPDEVGVGSAWCLGLFMDALSGMLLGQNALALALVAFLTKILRQRLQPFPIWQPWLIVIIIVGFGQLCLLGVQWFIGRLPESLSYWFSTLTSALIWPWLAAGLNRYRRQWTS